MDGGDRWRVGFHGSQLPEESSIISKIMLKFRPIMPKPTSANTSTSSSHQDNKRVMLKTKRSKRKYVRIKKNNNSRKVSRTLQLMPKKDGQDCMKDVSHADRTAQKVVKLTVDCVAETCGGLGLGCTDDEIMSNLAKDTCPAFVSDCSQRVEFVNNAYKRFVMIEDVMSCLVLKCESLPREFSCRVKLQCYDLSGKLKCSKIVPCDVWRMEFGGFAWKLDVQAALSLGL